MWKKITSNVDIEGLKVNSIIVRYPINGDPLNSFKDANTDNCLLRAVKKIDSELDDVILLPLCFNIKTDNLLLGLKNIVFSDIKVNIDSLKSGVWWRFDDESN